MNGFNNLMKSIFKYLFLAVLCSLFINFTSYGDGLKVLKEKTFQIASGKKLNLDASMGDVDIKSWDKQEVYVKILGNQKAEDKVDFSFDNNDNEVNITAKKKGSFLNFLWGNGIKLKFEISVPANFNNYIRTSGGDIHFEGIKGDQVLKTSGGDIWVGMSDGDIKVSTSGGDINLDGSKGTIDLSTSGGDIMGRNFSGSLSCSTSGGDIKLIGSNSYVNAETSGGDIDLSYTGENKGIELSTSGGEISLMLPADFNASANLKTSGGSIDCDFKGNNAVKISSSRYEADFNSGGAKLIAKTSGGDITVKKQ